MSLSSGARAGTAANPFAEVAGHRERLAAGLVSGTSLDGTDCALVRIAGTGRGLRTDVVTFLTAPYPPALRRAVAACCERRTSDVWLVSQLGARLGHHFAEAVEQALDHAGLKAADLDVIGSHGQTVHHVPEAEPVAGIPTRSTLQLGDPDVIAARLGRPVISDFRAADVALGGQGAPLAPYLDDVLFADAEETRGLLNLGGIANLTVLPAGSEPGEVIAFDTGPANVLLDAVAQRLCGVDYDAGGARARRGRADEVLVRSLLAEPYFQRPPPKSTGRELFTEAYAARFIERGPNSASDLLATAAALTVQSVADACARFVEAPPEAGGMGLTLDRVLVSGGGVHNEAIMQPLADHLAPAIVEPTQSYGLDPDAKEAVLFAVLAHEFLCGTRTGLPRVTGASSAARQGRLTLP